MAHFGLCLALPIVLGAAVMKPARADVIESEVVTPVVPLTAGPPARVWYGWQVLAADGALLGLTAVALAGDAEDLGQLSLLGFFVAGPLVHRAHAGGSRALASLGMRLGLPVVGAIIGVSTATCSPDEWLCGVGEAAIGMATGMAVAIAIDSIWAYEDSTPMPAPTRPPRASWSVTPTVKVSETSAGIGLAARF
jgi:hypothetical protein